MAEYSIVQTQTHSLEKSLYFLILLFLNILIYLADLSSLLRDSTVIEEEERRGSSSDSSTCLVGTTTQGLDGTTPQKGKRFNVNMAECSVPKQTHTDLPCVCFNCDQMPSIDSQALGFWVNQEQRSFYIDSASPAAVITVTFSGCIIVDVDWKCQTEFVLIRTVHRHEPIYCQVQILTWCERRNGNSFPSALLWWLGSTAHKCQNVSDVCYCDTAAWKTVANQFVAVWSCNTHLYCMIIHQLYVNWEYYPFCSHC